MWLEIWICWSWDKFLGLAIEFSVSSLGSGPAICSWFRGKTNPKCSLWHPQQRGNVHTSDFWKSWNSVHCSLTRANITRGFSNTKLVPALLKKTPRKLSYLTLLILYCQEEKRQQRWNCHFPLEHEKSWIWPSQRSGWKKIWVLLEVHVIPQLCFSGK